MIRGVADVNVFVSAALTPHGVGGRALAAAGDRRWQPVVSPHLLEELEDALGREKVQRRLSPGTDVRLLREIQRVAELVPDAPQPWPPVTGDLKDDYLVALAKSASVDAIVSYDPHLTNMVDPVPPVMTPPAFLAMVLEGSG